jgi:hypothetical protein
MVMYEKTTGTPVEVWPVDARELLASGEYVAEWPAPAVTPEPPVMESGKRR